MPSVTLSIGHVFEMEIEVLDQRGNPMVTPPVFDAPPVWTDTTPATETVAAAANGQSATGTPIAPGTDTVSTSFTIGGKAFSASLNVEVDAAPQVPTSAIIIATVQ